MSTASSPRSISELRAARWHDVPERPGVYWWYFPQLWVERFQIARHCRAGSLSLRQSAEGNVCLYHGISKCLRQRVAWHAEQKLTRSALRTGFLSTFRLSLLALTGFDFETGGIEIDHFMDGLAISWQVTATRGEGRAVETAELGGGFHYPLNLQGNAHAELASFHQYLKSMRKSYRLRYL